MIKTEFKGLIDLYRRASQGEEIDDNQLFAASVSFLENLKFALNDGSVLRKEGLGMLEILRKYSMDYDEKRHQNRSFKSTKTLKEKAERAALKKKLSVLVRELGQFFQEGSSSEMVQPEKKEVDKLKKTHRRLSRKNWVRS